MLLPLRRNLRCFFASVIFVITIASIGTPMAYAILLRMVTRCSFETLAAVRLPTDSIDNVCLITIFSRSTTIVFVLITVVLGVGVNLVGNGVAI